LQLPRFFKTRGGRRQLRVFYCFTAVLIYSVI